MRSAAVVLAMLLAVSVSSEGCRRFDKTQVPVITVSQGLQPEISWTPSPAYLLFVYAGDKDGDGLGAIWSASGGGGYENVLRSPVVYGVPPAGTDIQGAPPLIEGRTYTVTVVRKDEKGSGDGFFNTRNRYVGVKTFVATK